jgi:cobalamin biosynthesis protein CbiG
LTGHPAAALARVAVPAPSARVAAAVGTASVAEAAALLAGGSLLVGRTVHGRVTVAVATP